ncbi:MAG TPA: hypothetical protein VFP20_05220 [Bacteroidales bacterium]|nr:hypothetical protein [Bacteroidales bacterium]
MKSKLFLTIYLAITSIAAIAQNSDEWTVSTLTVNGMHIWDKYSRSQVSAYLGVPTSYIDSVYSEPVESYVQECHFSDGCSFGFEAYRLTDFRLKTNRFKINGIIGVGDNISKLNQLTGGGPIRSERLKNSNTPYYYYPVLPNADDGIFFYYNSRNNIITEIYFETLF